MQKKTISTWAQAGLLAAGLSVFLGLGCGWWQGTGYKLEFDLGGNPLNDVNTPGYTSGHTSNLNNVLRY